ncbi:MAG: hypothetical protein IT440_11565, partial [Phycisphaeraceae bacterium]|nr:hypothetical protein [Phycisphaeraceae bacterium]
MFRCDCQRGDQDARKVLVLFICCVLQFGCQGAYNRSMDPMLTSYSNHQFTAAAAHAAERVQTAAERDALLVRLEHGAVLRAAGDWAGSNKVFMEADRLWEEHQAAAEVDLTDESFATVTKLSMLPYHGRAYDGIMMNLYMAFNSMALGDLDEARIQIDRTYFRQKDAVARNAERIEKAQEAAQSAATDEKQHYDSGAAENDDRFRQQKEEAYRDLEEDARSHSAYANYVNPYAQLVRGIFLMSCGH